MDCSSSEILVGKLGCLDTQEGIVGRLFFGLVCGRSCVETGIWSEVVDLCVRGSQSVRVCGCKSWRVDVNMLV